VLYSISTNNLWRLRKSFSATCAQIATRHASLLDIRLKAIDFRTKWLSHRESSAPIGEGDATRRYFIFANFWIQM